MRRYGLMLLARLWLDVADASIRRHLRSPQWRCAVALAFAIVALPASACSYPPPATFDQQLLSARSVYVFRVESLGMTPGSESSSGELAGRIRVTQLLKGPVPKQQFVSFIIGWCGGIHLDVGNYYVVATSRTGRTLVLGPGDRSVLDLGGRIQPPRRSRDEHGILEQVESALKSGKVPEGFPHREDVARTDPMSFPTPVVPRDPQR